MLKDKLKFFAESYSAHKKAFSFVVVGSLLGAGLGLLSPMLIRHVMDELLPHGISAEMILTAGALLTIYATNYFLNYKVEVVGRGMGAKIEFTMREKLFRHLLRMGYSFYDNAQSGQLLSRLVNDISEVGGLMFAIPHLFITCSITMLGSVTLLFWLNWQLATVVTALLIIKTFTTIKLNCDMKKMFMRARENTGDLSGQISESLQGIRLVKIFSNENKELDKMIRAGKNLLSIQEHSFRTIGKLHGGVEFFSNVMNLTIIVLGGALISLGQMKISDLVAFLLYMMMCMRPVFQLMMLTEVYQRGGAGKDVRLRLAVGRFADPEALALLPEHVVRLAEHQQKERAERKPAVLKRVELVSHEGVDGAIGTDMIIRHRKTPVRNEIMIVNYSRF